MVKPEISTHPYNLWGRAAFHIIEEKSGRDSKTSSALLKGMGLTSSQGSLDLYH